MSLPHLFEVHFSQIDSPLLGSSGVEALAFHVFTEALYGSIFQIEGTWLFRVICFGVKQFTKSDRDISYF